MLENLRALRKAEGVTQLELAEAIGVTQQSVNKYENHNIEPDIESLKRIADFFDTSIDYIVGHSELRFRPEELENYALNDEEARMIAAYRRLTSKQRSCVDAVMRAFLEP